MPFINTFDAVWDSAVVFNCRPGELAVLLVGPFKGVDMSQLLAELPVHSQPLAPAMFP